MLHIDRFRFPPELCDGVRGKRVLITGAGRHGGIGQALALAAGLNGAECVGVHFHRSYNDGLETVELIQQHGGDAFPVQADVTSPADLWATRSYVIRRMGGKPPDLVICNSGMSEQGYLLGRAPRDTDGESIALRRARGRQAFVDNLEESRQVLATKIDGFLGMTHLWSGEAIHAGEPLRIVYISSRQAVDPGAGVPGYVMANWGVLSLPRLLRVNVGKAGKEVTAFSVALPFVRTGMTEAYADNPKVFGRWQARMLEPDELAHVFLTLLHRPAPATDGHIYQLDVDRRPDGQALQATWSEVALGVTTAPADWSAAEPLELPLDATPE